MKRIIKKVIKITALILIFAPIVFIIIFNMGTRIDRVGTTDELMEEYSDYYIYKYNYLQFQIFSDPCNGASAYSRIWFLPFQKTKLLNRIKQDVFDVLDNMLISNDIAAVDYQVSDDFKEVFIYIDKYRTASAMHYDPMGEEVLAMDRYWGFLKREVGRRVELYDQLSHRDRSVFVDQVIRYIEIDPDTK